MQTCFGFGDASSLTCASLGTVNAIETLTLSETSPCFFDVDSPLNVNEIDDTSCLSICCDVCWLMRERGRKKISEGSRTAIETVFPSSLCFYSKTDCWIAVPLNAICSCSSSCWWCDWRQLGPEQFV